MAVVFPPQGSPARPREPGLGELLRSFFTDTRQLMADFAQLGLSRLDNTEGMCWGPQLPNGHRSLVVVSDDNFNARQVTQFAAFDYGE